MFTKPSEAMNSKDSHINCDNVSTDGPFVGGPVDAEDSLQPATRNAQPVTQSQHMRPPQSNDSSKPGNHRTKPLKILFYAPFKPLGHSNPSGDLMTATGIYQYLENQGHSLNIASRLRTRWIYWKPWMQVRVWWEKRHLAGMCAATGPDLWLTYHSYYKGPDVLGPAVSRTARIPYVIFQGIYSTKRRRDFRTRPGFKLNTRALLAARHVFTNKRVDYTNLMRLLPVEKITYVAPGIVPEAFEYDDRARQTLRRQWGVGEAPVILAAAMFRPDVKSRGLRWMIETCGRLLQENMPFAMVIAGDGKERANLEQLAGRHLPGRVRFIGKIERDKMNRVYSAADVFVFPGIGESLGMVYLEAQSCGLPVVAFDNAGVPEVVCDQVTGFLEPMYAADAFVRAVGRLLTDSDLRRQMGERARAHVRRHHDLNLNYRKLDEVLNRIVRDRK
jgi:glycosyltransferase involved in cell wall biosynthesis